MNNLNFSGISKSVLFQCLKIKQHFLQKSHVSTKTKPLNLGAVSVIGCGLMGSGIAQVCAQKGYKVMLLDSDNEKLVKTKEFIRKSIIKVSEKLYNDTSSSNKFVNTTISNLHFTTDIKTCVAGSDLIIEAIIENLTAKRQLFSEIEKVVSDRCILASNTSSLSLKDISFVLKNKNRFGGLHFFNPVPVMKLVEVISTEETSTDTFETLVEFAESLDKKPVICRDTPGFICNRLLVPYLAEAFRMLERGDASAADIDCAMKLGAGYPMGPFELSDLVGLDTVKFVLSSFASKDNNRLFEIPSVLNNLCEGGKLGKKTGEGVYKYDIHGKKLIS